MWIFIPDFFFQNISHYMRNCTIDQNSIVFLLLLFFRNRFGFLFYFNDIFNENQYSVLRGIASIIYFRHNFQ